MTELMYMSDSYKKDAKATIISVEKHGLVTEVILDRTIFYPQGGGQPSDKGTITGKNGIAHVKHVRLTRDTVVHECSIEGSIEPNEGVHLKVNWKIRYHNMCIHSAGHVVHE